MNIIYTNSYKNSFKKIKKYNREYQNLMDILDIIENADDFNTLLKIPTINLYNFERLKYELNAFYSFNLSKNGGKIRLIVKPNENNSIEIYLVFISYNHYDDFSLKKVIYNE